MDQKTLDALRKKGYLPPATAEEKTAELSKDEGPAVVRARSEYTAKIQAAVV